MELKVNAVSIPEAITFNYEELKTGLMEKVAMYEAMVYTEDQIQLAKQDRAALNNLKKALNAERLKREREYMKPFALFKSQIDEIIRIIDKPVAVIDQQIKAAEERRKEEKHEAIIEFWNECNRPDAIRLDQIMDPKWLNASTSMKSIKDAIVSRLDQIGKDLAVIHSLPSYAFEAEQMYLSTLDLARSVSEAHRLQDMAEKKAAYEAEQARRKAEAEAQAPQAPAVPDHIDVRHIPSDMIEVPDEPIREWVRFQALMTVEEAKALGQYMRSHGIKYKAC